MGEVGVPIDRADLLSSWHVSVKLVH